MRPSSDFRWVQPETPTSAYVMAHKSCASDPHAELVSPEELKAVLAHNPNTGCGVCGKPLDSPLP